MSLIGSGVHLDGSPAVVEGQLEGSSCVGPVMVEVGVSHTRNHCLEILAPHRGRLPLHHRDIGATSRAHIAVAPVLTAQPFLGVIAVLGFEPERVPLARRIPTPPDVLSCDGVASRCEVHAVLNDGLVVVVIGRPNQDRGDGRVDLRQVDVGGQFNPVTHGDFYIERHADFVNGPGSLGYTESHCRLHREIKYSYV